MTNLTTYPRIDRQRGVAMRVDRTPGEKVCAFVYPYSLHGAIDPTGSLAPFRLDAHFTACLTVCMTVIRDALPFTTPHVIHRAMVTARRVLEGGGTICAAVHWAIKPYDDYDLRSPS